MSASAVHDFFRDTDTAAFADPDMRATLDALLGSAAFRTFLLTVIDAPVFAPDYGRAFATLGASRAIAPCRMLRSALNLTLEHCVQLMAEAAAAFGDGDAWYALADRLHRTDKLADIRLRVYLTDELPEPSARQSYASLVERLIDDNPHAVYPTSPYRESSGRVESSHDHRNVEAVIHGRPASRSRRGCCTAMRCRSTWVSAPISACARDGSTKPRSTRSWR